MFEKTIRRHSFGARVDHGSKTLVFRPTGLKAPLHCIQYSRIVALNNRHHGLGWRNIIAGFDLGIHLVDMKRLLNISEIGFDDETTALDIPLAEQLYLFLRSLHGERIVIGN